MSPPNSFRARLNGLVDSRHPLVVLTGRLPWAKIEQVLTPHFARKAAPTGTETAHDLLDRHQVEFGGGGFFGPLKSGAVWIERRAGQSWRLWAVPIATSTGWGWN